MNSTTTRRGFLGTTTLGLGALALGCDDGLGDAADPDVEGADAFGGLSDAGARDADVTDLGGPDGEAFDGEAYDGEAQDAGAPDAEAPDAAPVPECDDPFAGGELVELIDFEGDPIPFHEAVNGGWDGRLYTDLSEITPDTAVIANDRFFVRTFYPDSLRPEDAWTLRLRGLVGDPVDVPLDELAHLVRPMGAHVLECSGNGGPHFGLLSAAEWDGIPLAELLAFADVDPSATAVLISGVDDHVRPSTHSTPGASWVFTFDQLERSGAFLATRMNGEPLPLAHGFPVRLYVPGWYGCTNIKWVDEFRFVGPDEPATAQMHEFDTRTHQPRPTPALARDFRPASQDQAALPVRLERWRVEGRTLYRVVGILWGGGRPTDALRVRFGADAAFEPVDVCPSMTQNDTWTVWQTAWAPASPGLYDIRCAIDDADIPTNRLDSGFYARTVRITDV